MCSMCRTAIIYVFQIINNVSADGIIKVYTNLGNEIFCSILYDKSDIAVVHTDEYTVKSASTIINRLSQS